LKTNKKELLSFFIISFAWMWLINLPRVLEGFNLITLNPFLSMMMGYIAVFGPGIAAFMLTSHSLGKEGLRSLWNSGWRLPQEKRWLLPAVFLIPLSALATLGFLRLLDVSLQWEYGLSPAMIVPIGLLIWLVGAYPEEYGWRGYALPRLLENLRPLAASLILGFIWGVWHLPLHFIPATTQFVIPIWQYLLLTVVLSILYTWLYLGTGGSVFVASLFHASGNIAGALIPYWTSNAGRWVSFLILIIPAGVIIWRWQSKKEKLRKVTG
jgi:membrane protease YdiL (CAAX protease family)